jgi:hypothetical protein
MSDDRPRRARDDRAGCPIGMWAVGVGLISSQSAYERYSMLTLRALVCPKRTGLW